MKILHLINNLGPGGAEKLLVDLCPIMAKHGHTVDVCLLRKAGSVYIEELANKNINIMYLSDDNMYSIKRIIQLKKLFLTEQYEVIHVHLFPALYYAAVANFVNKKKYNLVYTEHSTTNRRREKTALKFFDKIIYSAYKCVIGITEEVLDNFKQHVPAYDGRVSVVNNGIDSSVFQRKSSFLKKNLIKNVRKKTKIVTMIGRFSPAKDQKTLIRALEFLDKNIQAVFVGAGPLKQECENLAIVLGLQERVHFLGIRHDIPDILAVTDIGVLSSNWEGFGIVAVETMASGTPLVASNVSGLSSVVGNAGLLFEVGDEKQLAAQIKKLLSDSDLYNEISILSKKRAEKFSIDETAEGYLRQYQLLCANK